MPSVLAALLWPPCGGLMLEFECAGPCSRSGHACQHTSVCGCVCGHISGFVPLLICLAQALWHRESFFTAEFQAAEP
jgi:hypothetical protein